MKRTAYGLPAATVAALLTRLLNAVVAADPDARAGLARLDGRVVALEITGIDQMLFVEPAADGASVATSCARPVDVRIAGGIRDFVAMVRARKKGEALAAGRLEIRGDLATAQQVEAFLGEVKLDWEELLAHHVGDITAHQLGRAVRGFGAWASGAAELLRQDLAEYLQHELEILPTPDEHARFVEGAKDLASDAERVAARLRALQQRLART